MNRFLFIILYSFIFMQEFDGYTLFTPSASNIDVETILMDNDYNFINVWSHDFNPASMPYLLPDSSIIYPYKVDFPTMAAGGVGGGIQKISWSGDIIWDYTFSDSTYQHHHDIEPLPNGNILILLWEKKTASEAYLKGRTTINNALNQMWSTAVLELDPALGTIVWEWHLWDHLIQDTNPEIDNYGVISEHPELFDINCGDVGVNAGGPQEPNGDWMHMNSIHYNSSLNQIILSSRLQNEFYIIDHTTTTEEATSHSGGDYGKGGDILYRWGNPQNYDRGSESDRVLSSQHSVNWIPTGYPGEGNIILFNNFHDNNGSGVIEISPPLNNQGEYIVNDGEPFGPFDLEWEYICDIIVPIQGGAFRLPNGNTLITETHNQKIIEVDNAGNSVWEYIDQNGWIYRANKYNQNFSQDIFIGDVNLDNSIDILDVVFTVNIIIQNDNNIYADLNQDGIVDILDIILLINIILD